MKNMMIKAWTKVMNPVKNEKGAQSLEWLGIAALLILVLGIVSTAVSNQEGGISSIIENIIQKITDMVG
ncbi:hypothetical protein [Bacillus mesophilum]|uniref:Uncharacterized protein n=1 Tax=Bacillus mesophilum TaxID=1071718 RepID=A0A7V7RIJ9_9BACI|nr:hypothetical protein [Bacillus mesophilum]KAB2330082.1 hypothetical protein F7732_20070 [Bacillus mesophilum]